ncbi:MAG: hypothetical protein LBF40_03310 [Deltaproteobacteria bacterium]|jgi:hypothetical protein|nr:hypothetical protein [Deltaproteobacteria bacterium]
MPKTFMPYSATDPRKETGRGEESDVFPIYYAEAKAVGLDCSKSEGSKIYLKPIPIAVSHFDSISVIKNSSVMERISMKAYRI